METKTVNRLLNTTIPYVLNHTLRTSDIARGLTLAKLSTHYRGELPCRNRSYS